MNGHGHSNGLHEPLLDTNNVAPERQESSLSQCQLEEVPPVYTDKAHKHSVGWGAVTTALLSLQLGWGLWLFPSDYARIGWYATGVLVALALLTAYSGTLFTRLYLVTPGAVLFSDVGKKAAGKTGAMIVSVIIYSLDATRCVILHLAATQSLRHAFPEETRPPLWLCGFAVLVLGCILVQVRSMAEMSWVFMTGTGSQLVAVAIVVYELVTNPDPNARTTNWAVQGAATYVPAAVALMNMIFAFGGQFAFTEIMGSMRTPAHFPRAVSVCTVIMGALYGGLGVIGYWSRGDEVREIVIFSLPESPRARLAAGCILVQAIAQYLINVNVWTHNLLVLLARQGIIRKRTLNNCVGHAPHDHEHAHDAESAHDHAHDAHDGVPTKSTDHCKWWWAGTSCFVVIYSYGISISLPFFSTLVGLVTACTYLVCAYLLPAWFTLKLLGSSIHWSEKGLLYSLIPLSVIVSGIGLWASIVSLINNMGSGEGWGVNQAAQPLLALARASGMAV